MQAGHHHDEEGESGACSAPSIRTPGISTQSSGKRPSLTAEGHGRCCRYCCVNWQAATEAPNSS